ncbi:MAG TPA: cytochrome c [Gammaproteobacteria bacterium]|nr:cytochrome c [Gammaproteobacteria bacterium]
MSAATRTAAIAALTLLFASAASAQQTAVQRGDAKFQHSCTPCHGAGVGDDGRAMLPGTDALRIKYRDAKPPVPALLEQRTDLTAPAIRAFVRNGSFSMPPFRPTELTDAEISDIAAYIADKAKRAPRR